MFKRKQKDAAPVDSTTQITPTEEAPATAEPTAESKPEATKTKTGFKSKLAAFAPRNLKSTIRRHPRRSAAVGVVLLIIILLFAIPATRYKILGLVIKNPADIKVLNASSKQAVSEATVTLDGQEAKTDANGVAHFSAVPVGDHTATIHKSYYKDGSTDIFVGMSDTNAVTTSITATGQPVSVLVVNTVSKKPVGKATITIGNEKYTTKDDGTAQVQLASDAKDSKATLSADGFNQADITITAITAEKADAKNTFTITPAGKVYFLSKRTGKIDVMKSNLDGTNQEVVLTATGNESETDTILLASRDWKYLALKAKRDTRTDKNALYIIDTSDDSKLITADEGDAEFTLSGWKDHTVVYTVLRNDIAVSDAGSSKLKSYDATTKKLTTLVTSGATGYAYQIISDTYLTDQNILYSVNWNCSNAYYVGYYSQNNARCADPGAVAGVYTINADGSSKKTLLEKEGNKAYFSTRPYELNEFYISYSGDGTYYEYDSSAGSAKQVQITSSEFYKTYPTPIISPSSQATAWTEQRDGKTVVLVGDKDGKNEKPVANLDDTWAVYGWYSEDYLLLSKKSSELYTISVSGGSPVKITDYHKPVYDFYGYGGGYGGN